MFEPIARCALYLLVTLSLAAPAALPAEASAPAKEPSPGPASVGAMAFAPDGALLVADSKTAAIFSLRVTDEGTPSPSSDRLVIEEVDAKIAALLGVTPRDVLVNDMAVHPSSRAIYLSLSRGKGEDALPAIARVGHGGEVSLLDLAAATQAHMSIHKAPAEDATDRRGRSLRAWAITDLELDGNNLYVAGLSNEEFASTLRTLSYPFGTQTTSSVEIFHGAHGRFETHAPIRSLLAIRLEGKKHLLAGYTCTPLVSLPVAELADGSHVKGKTVAELGNRNTPVDMLRVEKDGKEWVVVINSTRAGMRIDPADIAKTGSLSEKVEDVTAGVPFVPLALGGVQRIADLDAERLVTLRRVASNGSLALTSWPKSRI